MIATRTKPSAADVLIATMIVVSVVGLFGLAAMVLITLTDLPMDAVYGAGAAFFTIVLLATIGTFIWGVAYVLNNWFLRKKETVGTIVDVSFKPAHVERYLQNVYLVMLWQTRSVPDTWNLKITTEQGTDWMRIEHAPWPWQQKQAQVSVEYVKPRLFGQIEIMTIKSAVKRRAESHTNP